MVDIYCVQCGEPWDAWGASHGDMEAWEYDLFRKGAGCPGCKGKPETPFQPTKLEHVEFGDEDPALRINAFADRDEGKLPPWEPPPPPKPHYGDVWEAMEPEERKWLNADEEDLEHCSSFSWGKLNYKEDYYHDIPVCVPRYLCGGDYANSCSVEIANHKVFMEKFGDVDGVYELYGGHGTFGVAILASVDNKEMAEMLAALNDYCVINEDVLSEVEMELQEEAWDNWAQCDFVRELEKLHKIDDLGEYMDGDQVFSLFHWAMNEIGEDWQSESGRDMHIDVKRIAEHCTIDDIMRFGKEQ